MSIWAIGDLHLALSIPDKSMEHFGKAWENYAARIEQNWKDLISENDLVLLPGDLCWAMSLDDALVELQWIDALPGTKVIIRGNHDYWWSSPSKMKAVFPPSVHFIQNNAFNWNDVTIGGARLWDTPEYRFSEIIAYQENTKARVLSDEEILAAKENQEKIFVRDLERLKLSLQQLDSKANLRIAMTHYPPIGLDLKPSRVSKILEEFKINICVFGHLHSIKDTSPLFGEARGVKYVFTSSDYLEFRPIQLR